uniref:Uncharacterized protein n=1 Tax=Picea glauca TaxID=3330 RepID=A0A101M2H2_PICGL|nr:hypothetical protein ABT39_MTgene2891 [Picea glauca]QHR87577.1 hypothetical protein Q903MT_gene1588 [Picea sitchensis]
MVAHFCFISRIHFRTNSLINRIHCCGTELPSFSSPLLLFHLVADAISTNSDTVGFIHQKPAPNLSFYIIHNGGNHSHYPIPPPALIHRFSRVQ